MTFNLFLVGPMGTGKSSIGRELARILGKSFYDTDHLIRERSGVNIDWIYEVEGEAGIRKREHTILQEITRKTNVVLATGGGTVLLMENRQLLQSNGTVVYLQSDIQNQLKRTQLNQHNRPTLQSQQHALPDRLQELQQEREPFYAQIADITFCTDNKGVRATAQAIAKMVTGPNP